MTMGTETMTVEPVARRSLLGSMAAKYEIEPAKFLATVKATVFDARATDEEMIAFLAVANKYDLDPFRGEIFAFRKSEKGVQPIVGVDGWSSIANRQPSMDGVDFADHFEDGRLVSTTCRIHRKDRGHPTSVTEYATECARKTIPWQQWPARMLRHKAFIQCVRLAFGVSGIVEPDEMERLVEAEVALSPKAPQTLSDLTEKITKKRVKKDEAQATETVPEPTAPAASVSAPSQPAAVEVTRADLLKLVDAHIRKIGEERSAVAFASCSLSWDSVVLEELADEQLLKLADALARAR